MHRYMALLRDHPDYARLWLAQVVSLTGDWFSTIVLSALVIKFSPDDMKGAAISAFLLARFVPPMLLSPFAGVLVDRFNRKHLLIASNVLRIFVTLGFLLTLDDPDRLWLVYALSITQFVLSSVFEPGQSALIPALVARERLVEANTLVSVTWSVMLALGAIIGGVVATVFGPATALVIDAATFLVAALLLTSIRTYRHVPRATGADAPKTGLIDGLRYLRQRPEVAAPLMVKAGNSLGNVDALMTIFATQIFVLGTDGQLSLSILYSAFGFGAILGPLLFNRVNDGSVPRMMHLMTFGFVMACVGWLVMGAAGSLLAVCAGLLVRAMGGSVNWTYSTVVIQKTADDAYLGRVFSLDMMGFYFATVVSTLAHGALIDAVGTQNVSVVAFGTFFVALLPLLAWVLIVRVLARRALTQRAPVLEVG